ncbi:MAG: FAD-dependent oxidoreductase [Terriglobia bacterium]
MNASSHLPLAYRPVCSPTGKTLAEPSRRLPVWAEVDLCIVGGGAAGVAAAVGAAAAGVPRILLVERYGFCGGAAVAGMSGTIGGLFASGTGKPDFVTQGFSREFHDRLRARGGVADPWPFGKTFLSVHDPLAWKELANDYLLEHRIYVLFHSLFVDAVLHDRRVTHVILENKNGRGAIAARAFIDASGDADLVERARGATTLGKNGVTQSPTMIFRMMNVDVQRAAQTSPEILVAKLRQAQQTGAYYLPRTHCYMYPSPRTQEYSCNMTRLDPPAGSGKACLSGLDTDDLTFCEMQGLRLVREYERFLRNYIPGFEQAFVNDTGTQIGIRQTRSIVGRAILRNADVLSARKFGDQAISRSAWPIEDHSGAEVRIVYLDHDYYEIPRDALIPENLDNVWAAGRCLSAEHAALASARVTAQCMDMGYAGGQMAADALLSH